MLNRDDLAKEALNLSEEDRLYIADILETSVIASNIAEEWGAEVDRRLEAYERGEITAIDVETSLAKIRKKLTGQDKI